MEIAVLEQVAQARQRVGQSIAQMETSEADLQAVMSEAGQRMAALQERFNAFLSHIQEETARATEALESVVSTAQDHEAWTRAETARTNEESRDTASSSAESDAGFVEAARLLAENQQVIAARTEANQAFYEQIQSQAEDAHQAHASSLTQAGEEIADSQTRLQDVESSQRDRVTAVVDGPLTEARSNFEAGLSAAVVASREALDAQSQHVQAGAQDSVENLTSVEGEERSSLVGDLEAMSEALSQLGHLVSETSQTMMRGADEASELMQMTGLGVNTVIGLVENLREIFNEIESAWS